MNHYLINFFEVSAELLALSIFLWLYSRIEISKSIFFSATSIIFSISFSIVDIIYTLLIPLAMYQKNININIIIVLCFITIFFFSIFFLISGFIFLKKEIFEI